MERINIMNASDKQPYQTANPIGNVDQISTRLDMLIGSHPDMYVVINTSKPLSEQAIILLDHDIAVKMANAANIESFTQRYIAVKATELKR